AMDHLIADKDYLFNLAGQVSHLDSMQDPFTDLDINCRSQLAILESCRHRNPQVKVVFAGSRQQYGRPRYLPVDEQHPLRPVDVNGINKLAGEWYHILYNETYGVRAVSLRLTNTYGPGQLVKHSRQGFIAWFLRQALEGGEIELFGDGTQLRDLTFVEDVVDAFLLAASAERANGQAYNLAGETPISLADVARLMIEITGQGSVRTVPFPSDRRRIDIGSYYGSAAKIGAELGWRPRTPLRGGLARTSCSYRDHLRHSLGRCAGGCSTTSAPAIAGRRRASSPPSVASSRVAATSSTARSSASSGNSPATWECRTWSAPARAPPRSSWRCGRSTWGRGTRWSCRRSRPRRPPWPSSPSGR